MTQAVYKIISKKTGIFYVGATNSAETRLACHLCALRKNKHTNYLLQKHYNKYGIDDLFFEIVSRHNKYRIMRRHEAEIIKSTNKELLFNIDGVPGRKKVCLFPMRKRKYIYMATTKAEAIREANRTQPGT